MAMKKVLLAVLLAAVASVGQRLHGYVGYKQTVKNDSGSVIRVRWDYHGASKVACRKDEGDVDPGTARTWKSYG
jgi:hypothetical protein